MTDGEVKLIVHKDGRASLWIDECFIGQIGRVSGIELLDSFNKLMVDRHLPYRMHSDYSLMLIGDVNDQ